jgi:hypothetical protein
MPQHPTKQQDHADNASQSGRSGQQHAKATGHKDRRPGHRYADAMTLYFPFWKRVSDEYRKP